MKNFRNRTPFDWAKDNDKEAVTKYLTQLNIEKIKRESEEEKNKVTPGTEPGQPPSEQSTAL